MIQSWQRVTRQKVTQSFTHVKEITFPPLTANKGTGGQLVIEAEISGHAVHRIYVDGGTSMKVLYKHCFNWLWPEIKSQMVPVTTSLTGFSGETVWSLGQLRLLVTIGDAEHYTRAWMNFMIVRLPSPYNSIIGRPEIREIQALPSTAHGMLKFLVNDGIVTIRSTIPTQMSVPPLQEHLKTMQNRLKHIHPDFPDQEITIGRTEYHDRLPNTNLISEKDIPLSDRGAGPGAHQGNPSRDKKTGRGRDYARSILPRLVIQPGYAEGMFLGYMINLKRIKPCPDKTEAVLQLLTPQTIKEVQSLNRKLASQNVFISKSAEKSLPLFKTLKKCIKKSDFHWTPDAEHAFKQLTQHLARLPILVAPKPKEELIMYLSAFYGAISAVLMTERDTVQTPVYFVSRALQALELNYTPMEKLVLTLVYAAKKVTHILSGASHHGHHRLAHQASDVTSRHGRAIAKMERHARGAQYHIPTADICERPYPSRLPHRSSCVDGLGVGLILTSPERTEFTYALSMHAGPRSVVAKAMRFGYYWPTMHRDARDMIRTCNACQIEVKVVAKITSHQVKKFVWDNIVYRFGLPGEIVSDNGKQFSDNPFKDWCEKLNITQRFALVKHSQSNGLVEKANRSLEIEMLMYRTAVVDSANNNEELRLNLDLLEEWRECATIREAREKLKMTKYYNTRVYGVTFRPGDFVYHSNEASHAMDGGKLSPKWEGPYEVTEALRDGAYRLRSTNEVVFPRM
nr:reverse transcriptase domain-containing protein [Tanacetum cinerariifolium]